MFSGTNLQTLKRNMMNQSSFYTVDSMFLQNIDKILPKTTVLHPIERQCSLK